MLFGPTNARFSVHTLNLTTNMKSTPKTTPIDMFISFFITLGENWNFATCAVHVWEAVTLSLRTDFWKKSFRWKFCLHVYLREFTKVCENLTPTPREKKSANKKLAPIFTPSSIVPTNGFALSTNCDKVRVVTFQAVQLSRFHRFSIESYSLSKLNGKSKKK